jgi:hypothetical protein
VTAADRWDELPAAREEEGTPSAAETLREAARVMRERANGTETPSPWWLGAEGRSGRSVTSEDGAVVMRGYVATADAAHIASWHPTVALAVASLLETTAAWLDEGLGRCDDLYATNYPDAWNDQREAALTVARAYLGGHR